MLDDLIDGMEMPPTNTFNPLPIALDLAKELQWKVAKGQQAVGLAQTLSLVVAADQAGAEVLRSEEQHMQAAVEHVQARESLNSLSPGLAELLLGQQTAVNGTYRERSVLVIPQAVNPDATRRRPAQQNIAMMLSRPLALQLYLYPESFASKIGKLFLRHQDIVLGNAELDPLVMIKARDEAGALQILGRPEVQEALLALYRQRTPPCYPQCNDVALRATVQGRHNLKDLLDLLKTLSNLANTLEA